MQAFLVLIVPFETLMASGHGVIQHAHGAMDSFKHASTVFRYVCINNAAQNACCALP